MNADIFTDAEVLTMLDNVLNQPSIEDIERNRARRRRVAKADFFNLKEVRAEKIHESIKATEGANHRLIMILQQSARCGLSRGGLLYYNNV